MDAPRDALATVNQLRVVYCLLSGQLNTIPAKEAKTNIWLLFKLLFQKLVILRLHTPRLLPVNKRFAWPDLDPNCLQKGFQQAAPAGKEFNQQMTFHIIVWQHFWRKKKMTFTVKCIGNDWVKCLFDTTPKLSLHWKYVCWCRLQQIDFNFTVCTREHCSIGRSLILVYTLCCRCFQQQTTHGQ